MNNALCKKKDHGKDASQKNECKIHTVSGLGEYPNNPRNKGKGG